MQTQFLGFDPLIGTEIMDLVGADATKLSIPQVYKKISEIINYFGPQANYRLQILKVLDSRMARNSRGDNIDALWIYIQLQKEKEVKLKELDPKDFEEDIAKDIVKGHIPLEKKKRINTDIQKAKELLEKRLRDSQFNVKQGEAMNEVMDASKIKKYENTLQEIDKIDSQLSQF